MYFILLVLNNVEMLEAVLDDWEIAGAKGVTILHSIGFAKIKDKRSLQEDFPLIPGLDDNIETGQNQNRTLFRANRGQLADGLRCGAVTLPLHRYKHEHRGIEHCCRNPAHE